MIIPDTIKIKISFYNDDEKNKFQSYPNKDEINSIVSSEITISKEEFLTYLLFKEKKNFNKFRTYTDFRNKIPKSIALIEDYLSFENNSVKAEFIGREMNDELIERIGEALSLCAINKLHELTEADWDKIPIRTTKDFDYEISLASDGSKFIQLNVECKGSAVNDNTKKVATISNHKSSIDEKKEYISNEEQKLNIPKFQNLYYGVIVSIDNRDTTIAQCWLVDPPAYLIDYSSDKYKILSRLYFYYEIITEIIPQSTVTKLLINRIRDIDKSENINELSKNEFVNARGDSLIIAPNMFNRKSVIKSRFFQNVYGNNDEVFGDIIPYENRKINFKGVFFLGLMRDALEMVIEQDFERIFRFKKEFATAKKNLICRISNKRFREEFKLPEKIVYESKKDLIEFELEGWFIYNNTGIVYGLIPY